MLEIRLVARIWVVIGAMISYELRIREGVGMGLGKR